MIRAIAFDLDDTLLATSETITASAYDAATKVLLEGGVRSEDLKKLDLVYNTPTGFSNAVRTLDGKVDSDLLKKALNTYYVNADLSVLKLAPHAHYVLQYLRANGRKVGVERTAIVTAGERGQQEQKIRMFNLAELVNDVYMIPSADYRLKIDCFRNFCSKYNLTPHEIAAVGDKIDNEIRAGNELGMVTVRILQGRHSRAQPKDKEETPTYTVKNLTELLEGLNSKEIT